MLIIVDVQCSKSNEVFERLVDSQTRVVRCNCGAEAKRIITPINFKLDGSDPSFPGAYSKWVKTHEKKSAKNGEGEW